jgi:hypothetical protein
LDDHKDALIQWAMQGLGEPEHHTGTYEEAAIAGGLAAIDALVKRRWGSPTTCPDVLSTDVASVLSTRPPKRLALATVHGGLSAAMSLERGPPKWRAFLAAGRVASVLAPAPLVALALPQNKFGLTPGQLLREVERCHRAFGLERLRERDRRAIPSRRPKDLLRRHLEWPAHTEPDPQEVRLVVHHVTRLGVETELPPAPHVLVELIDLALSTEAATTVVRQELATLRALVSPGFTPIAPPPVRLRRYQQSSPQTIATINATFGRKSATLSSAVPPCPRSTRHAGPRWCGKLATVCETAPAGPAPPDSTN